MLLTVFLTVSNLLAQQVEKEKGKNTAPERVSLWLNSTALDSVRSIGLDKIEAGLYRIEFGQLRKWSGGEGECKVSGLSLRADLIRVKFEPKGGNLPTFTRNITFNHTTTRPPIQLKTEIVIRRDTIFRLDTNILNGIFLNPFAKFRFGIETGDFNPFNGRLDAPLYVGFQTNPLKRYTIAASVGHRSKADSRFGSAPRANDCGCEKSDVWTLLLEAGYKFRFAGKSFIYAGVQYETLLNGTRIPLDAKEELPHWRPYGATTFEASIGHDFLVTDKKLGVTNIETKIGASIDGGNFAKAPGQGLAVFVSIRATPVWKAQMKTHKNEPDPIVKWMREKIADAKARRDSLSHIRDSVAVVEFFDHNLDTFQVDRTSLALDSAYADPTPQKVLWVFKGKSQREKLNEARGLVLSLQENQSIIRLEMKNNPECWDNLQKNMSQLKSAERKLSRLEKKMGIERTLSDDWRRAQ